VVGDKIHSAWTLAANDLGLAMERFSPQLGKVKDVLIATAGGAGKAFLQMFFSMIIAGVFLTTAKASMAGTRAIFNGVVGERGELLLSETVTTVRSVARGVLGVAIIESVLTAIGLVAAGVPAAGFWTFMVLVLSIVQIPPMLTLVPLLVYVLSTSGPIGATVFIICAGLAVAVDTFLKPVMLGRTSDSPMLIVLMGAIGGMMLWGIIGLFVGAVVLVVCWEALEFWIKVSEDELATESPSSEPAE